MTKEMLEKELKKVNNEIIREEMVDLHYDFAKVAKLKVRKAELLKALAEM